MSVDLGALPQLPDPDTIIADAALIAASGSRVAANGTDYVNIWNGIQPHYKAPEETMVYDAMRPVTVFTDEAAVVTGLIQAALNTFAETVRGMQARHRALVAAAGVSYPESTEDDPDYGKNKEAGVAADIAALAAEYAAAEKACATAVLQSDPAQLAGPPGFTDTPGWDVANEAAEEALDRVRRERTRILIPAGTTQVTTLQIGHVFVVNSDGTAVSVQRVVLTTTDVQNYTQHDRTRLTFNPAPGTMVEVPKFAKRTSNALGVLDIGIGLYANYSEEWNQDLVDHPEYTEAERRESAAKNAAFEGIGGAVGGGLGGAAGGAIGGAAFGLLGSVVPVFGTAAGVAAGTFLGSVVGSTVGGALGEGAGSFLQDLSEGKSVGDAIAGGVEEFWDELW